MKCRGLDIGRRMQKDADVTKDPEVAIIQAFCAQAIQDVQEEMMSKDTYHPDKAMGVKP
jgi:hypothetical protein